MKQATIYPRCTMASADVGGWRFDVRSLMLEVGDRMFEV